MIAPITMACLSTTNTGCRVHPAAVNHRLSSARIRGTLHLTNTDASAGYSSCARKNASRCSSVGLTRRDDRPVISARCYRIVSERHGNPAPPSPPLKGSGFVIPFQPWTSGFSMTVMLRGIGSLKTLLTLDAAVPLGLVMVGRQ